MPELPEIEVARRDLEREVAGRKFKLVEVRDKKAVSRHRTKPEYVRKFKDRKVRSFDRRGPFIVGKLDSDEVWVVNLDSSGYLRRIKGGRPKPDSETKIVWTFAQGGGLLLGDKRANAESFVVPKEDLLDISDFAEMGLDPLETPVPWQQFGAILRQHAGSKIKSLLQNPRVVAGVGPVYSDEILFNAGLLYDRTPESFSAHEVRRLYRGMVETLSQAIKHRGTSLDEDDVDLLGRRGEYGPELKVFQRCGETCYRCRGTIDRVKFQKRYLFFCPSCQS